jgi:hypothetical protein
LKKEQDEAIRKEKAEAEVLATKRRMAELARKEEENK